MRGRYTYAARTGFPLDMPQYYRHDATHDSRESGESQRNKDAVLDTCVSPSVGVPVLRLMRLHNHVRLICNVWDCSNLNTVSDWTAIIGIYERNGDSKT